MCVLVLAALAPGLLLFLHHTQAERTGLLHEAQDRALRLARVWADNHDAVLREASLVLEAAIRDPAVASADASQCSAALQRLASQVGWTSGLAVVGRDGKISCATDADGVMLASLDPDTIDDIFTSQGLEIGEFHATPDGRSIAIIGLPRSNTAGGRDRAAIAAIDLAEEFSAGTSHAAAGAQFNIMVIGRGGTILAEIPRLRASSARASASSTR